MNWIAHRGNMNGPDETRENTIAYAIEAIKTGFQVEVDVHYQHNNLYLGHDYFNELVSLAFLAHPMLWCHAKTIKTFNYLLSFPQVHCFFHDADDVALTSRGFLWTFPGKPLTDRSVCVMPEKNDQDPFKIQCYACCSDYVGKHITKSQQ